jgi:hypothetical protein
MPPPIPQEVVDSCIDSLAFNVRDSDPTCQSRKALLLCSLVSRAFGQRARHHIFSKIRIKPSPGDIRSQQLRDIMKEDPNLCHFIRTLDIHIADAGHKKTATSKTGLPDILNMLKLRRQGDRNLQASPQIETLGVESIKIFYRLWLVLSTTSTRTSSKQLSQPGTTQNPEIHPHLGIQRGARRARHQLFAHN